MKSDQRYRILREVYDESRQNRLILRLRRAPDTENAWDSDALIWETRTQEGWTAIATVSREQFQGLSPRHRWIANIARVDVAQERAIIAVGEVSEPDSNGVVRAMYSWWEYDIRQKSPVRFIKPCVSPREESDESQ